MVFGLGRLGHRVVGGLVERGLDVLAVDFDPVAVARWREEDVRAVAVAAHYDAAVGRLEEAGADRVLLPYASAADEVVDVVVPPR